jgi:alkanesulfonate monooxygenase SsuD/methylene tetrahydromethanopterin reductase-like flavin-dependent oxidoreductase (luciferase family)
LPEIDPVTDSQTRTHGIVNSRDQPRLTVERWRRLATERGLTIRQLVEHLNTTTEFIGTPATVADQLTRYVRAGAIDGLNVQPNSVPDGFDDVVDRLVPELQDRGIYPTEYAGSTLRENLGLPGSVAARRRDRSILRPAG